MGRQVALTERTRRLWLAPLDEEDNEPSWFAPTSGQRDAREGNQEEPPWRS
jgi:hypothetical protein